ncbi:hypothetical protein [Chitinophaga rhizophila]|uniref:Uncharacterized protein n=1 Tax=Chitinophaga rhizophila TaxID=2866212 RepID=A0ABS7GEQ4_9BACT|nr:hypothetical protein [Chitinophaga rhizophila]MBW8686156.1 hypothetical protein [Chitinophaga rhizophila]
MLSEKENSLEKEPSEEYHQPEKEPAEVLKTTKQDNSSNPLHKDLSESPEDENAVVRDQDTKDTKD